MHPLGIGPFVDPEGELVGVALDGPAALADHPAHRADEPLEEEDRREDGQDRPERADPLPPGRVGPVHVGGLDGDHHGQDREDQHQRVVGPLTDPAGVRTAPAAALDLAHRLLVGAGLLLLVEQLLHPGLLDRALQAVHIALEGQQQRVPVLQQHGQVVNRPALVVGVGIGVCVGVTDQLSDVDGREPGQLEHVDDQRQLGRDQHYVAAQLRLGGPDRELRCALPRARAQVELDQPGLAVQHAHHLVEQTAPHALDRPLQLLQRLPGGHREEVVQGDQLPVGEPRVSLDGENPDHVGDRQERCGGAAPAAGPVVHELELLEEHRR